MLSQIVMELLYMPYNLLDFRKNTSLPLGLHPPLPPHHCLRVNKAQMAANGHLLMLTIA